jgi:hypothetical protein
LKALGSNETDVFAAYKNMLIDVFNTNNNIEKEMKAKAAEAEK